MQLASMICVLQHACKLSKIASIDVALTAKENNSWRYADMKKMLFVFNPHTGSGKLKNHMLDILCRFSAADFEVTVRPTAAAGDARKIVCECAEDYDIVVCCGGDGTMNEVVDGIKLHRPKPVLGYIPGGTTNDFASSLGLPKTDMMAAVDRIISPKKIYPCDFGIFNDRAFTYVAAFGAFTSVSYETPQSVKNMLGYFAYLIEGLQQLPSLQPIHARVECDEGIFEDDYMLGMVLNSVSVGGFNFPGENKVKMDDGLFELLLVRRPLKLSELAELYASVTSGKFDSHLLTIVRSKHLMFELEAPAAWTLDGEFGGTTDTVEIDVQHQGLLLCV